VRTSEQRYKCAKKQASAWSQHPRGLFMALMSFWEKDPDSVLTLSIEQIVAAAGDGKLKDQSTCAAELRNYLSQVPSEKLAAYVETCLSAGFTKSGLVLQDIVNELGRRLDYRVTNGRYQGSPSTIGHDGLWLSEEGHALVIEVKTTDGFRVSLETLAEYGERLRSVGEIAGTHSTLIVVGREDTGELEAQVRGSRHAWAMRLISAEALARLVMLKENAEEDETLRKIRGLLKPLEYTRLDELIDVIFATATDTDDADVPSSEADDTAVDTSSRWVFTDRDLLQSKRQAILAAAGNSLGRLLIRRSRATYWDNTKTARVVCTISKRYSRAGDGAYWFQYHATWNEFLGSGDVGLFVLGMMDQEQVFAIPFEVMRDHLPGMHSTVRRNGSQYWHVKVLESASGVYSLHLPKSAINLPLNQYRLSI
jgi:hypothetical protein